MRVSGTRARERPSMPPAEAVMGSSLVNVELLHLGIVMSSLRISEIRYRLSSRHQAKLFCQLSDCRTV